MTDITLKDYYISNNGKPTTNYKSIHFIMNNKESNEEEIQNYIISEPENEIVITVSDLSYPVINCFSALFVVHALIKFPTASRFIYRFEFPHLLNLGCRIAPGFQT